MSIEEDVGIPSVYRTCLLLPIGCNTLATPSIALVESIFPELIDSIL
jgi:hypothetical protein